MCMCWLIYMFLCVYICFFENIFSCCFYSFLWLSITFIVFSFFCGYLFLVVLQFSYCCLLFSEARVRPITMFALLVARRATKSIKTSYFFKAIGVIGVFKKIKQSFEDVFQLLHSTAGRYGKWKIKVICKMGYF